MKETRLGSCHHIQCDPRLGQQTRYENENDDENENENENDRNINLPEHAEPEGAWRSVPQSHRLHPSEHRADDQLV